jgi:hypothetical protein
MGYWDEADFIPGRHILDRYYVHTNTHTHTHTHTHTITHPPAPTHIHKEAHFGQNKINIKRNIKNGLRLNTWDAHLDR